MTKLFDQTITIKLNVKYTGDPEAFALALSHLSENPRAVDVSGAIPCALWRVLSAELSDEGDLLVFYSVKGMLV